MRQFRLNARQLRPTVYMHTTFYAFFLGGNTSKSTEGNGTHWTAIYLFKNGKINAKILHQDFRINLSKEERTAIHTIEEKRNVVIKDADKGSAIVVMDRERYINEALRHLSDDKCYSRLHSDPTQEYANELKVLVRRLHAENAIENENSYC